MIGEGEISSADGGATAGAEVIFDQLPLGIFRSQIVPPAPNRRKSAIDWLYDFGGASWIAYGASSFLVISHLPSPIFGFESEVGPFFQQVIEPPPLGGAGGEQAAVNAVSWCPAIPSKGELAAALGNCVSLYSPSFGKESGSFCWRHNAGIAQSFTVESIQWTQSGDGLAVASTEVVLWVKKSGSWQLAWKSREEVPQTLVSTTWSAEGPVATATILVQSSETNKEELSPSFREACKHVLVYYTEGKSGITKVQLSHPQPVSMIQWRPSTATQAKKDVLPSWRDVLLTCCLDGTARLWSEIDNGRGRRYNKEAYDQKTTRRSFHVVAVIEINQCLKGALGTDIFIEWAIEFDTVISEGEGDNYSLSSAGSTPDQIGNCEWLVCVGPRSSIAFWAVHCVDDISPLRFPRLTLWKNQNLMDSETCNSCTFDFPNTKNRTILVKASVLRSQPCGPPAVCSLLQLLPDNVVSWSQVYSQTSNNTEERPVSQTNKEEVLSCYAGVALNRDGHRGKIIQLAVHPYSCEVELAVSLDTNGILFFWSLSTLSFGTLNMHMPVHPVWRPLGKISLQTLYPATEYSSLSWAPSVLDEKQFLLLGHADGVDCFLVDISKKGEDVLFHKLLTIPFAGHDHVKRHPDHIFAIPLASSCGQSLLSSSFLVLATWVENFQVLSWKVVLHSKEPSCSNCRCNSFAEVVTGSEVRKYISSFADNVYCAVTELCSSKFPDVQNCNQVTSFAVVPVDTPMISIQKHMVSYSSLRDASHRFHMATGSTDGTLKLWKISQGESAHPEKVSPPWELVGMFTAHEGPVSAVSLSSCGGKIATVSTSSQNNTTHLHIWEPIFLTGNGSFLLEDVIFLDTAVISLNWLSIGNGRLLLGVCMPNEFRIYCERISDQIPAKSEKLKEMHTWTCIALSHTNPASHDFLWGPKVTPILVHDKHFSIFSQWLFKAKGEHAEDHSAITVGRTKQNFQCVCLSKENGYDAKLSSKNESSEKKGHTVCAFCLLMPEGKYDSDTTSALHSVLDVADMLAGSLAVYHPKALIQYLYSGNWKRAVAVVKHLVEHITSTEASVSILEKTKSGKSSHNIPEINLSRYFGDAILTNICSNGLQWGQDIGSETSVPQLQRNTFQFMEGNTQNICDATSKKSEIMGFINTLEKSHVTTSVPDIQTIEVLAILDLLCEISDSSYASPYDSFDEPGRRFWTSIRFQHLLFHRKFRRWAAAEEVTVGSDLVCWAFQSDCQETLLSSILSKEPSWLEMRNLGVGYWLTNASQLRPRMEKLARLQYLKNKDPKDCALLYLALDRLQVLSGLFKVNRNERDKLLVGFLSRNFQEEKNKAAALKNAYVLMGRHQIELAIAFFLLGNDPSSAVTVCAKNLGDAQLALVICRLIQGYGGKLEHDLISNVLLPDAIEKGDYWLSSLLEWTLGNYSHSFKYLFDSHVAFVTGNSAALCSRSAFSDPEIGQYCVVLTTKNTLKNSVGDFLTTVMSKLSILIAAKALNKCGLPLAALERLSSSLSIEGKDQGNLLDIGSCKLFDGILNPFCNGACNWLLGSVACHLELNTKLNMAMQYISKFLKDHPSWPPATLPSSGEFIIPKYDNHENEQQIEECKQNLNMVVSMLEQKYSLKMVDFACMILLFSCNKGLSFHGYLLIQDHISKQHDTSHHIAEQYIVNPCLPKLLAKASKEILYSFARYVVSCNFIDSALKLIQDRSFTFEKDINYQLSPRDFCLRSVLYSLGILRPLLRHFDINFSKGDRTFRTSPVLDLLEYCVYFASTWFRRNIKGMILMTDPIISASINDDSSFEAIADKLKNVLQKVAEFLCHDTSSDSLHNIADGYCNQKQSKRHEPLMPSTPFDEMWQLIGACSWIHLSKFGKHQLGKLLAGAKSEDERSMADFTNQYPILIGDLLKMSLGYISSLVTKQLASFLRQDALKGSPVTALLLLDESSRYQSISLRHDIIHGLDTLQFTSNQDSESLFKILWEISFSPKEIQESFVNEKVSCYPYCRRKLSGAWNDVHSSILHEYENGVPPKSKTESSVSSSTSNNESGPLLSTRFLGTDGLLETTRKDSSLRRDIPFFHNPCEVINRSGELLEAICFNSTDEQQVVAASNRKGLLFFDWKTEQPFRKQAKYIWSECDWPQDGWLGCESTQLHAHVSSAFADSEKPIDPPATLESISPRTLSRHPLKPFFLVGSSGKHVYLWEFGKDRATATYAERAFASISALRFDHCGHRFATAALDGTVCTWQLGANVVHPTESSLCFNSHASYFLSLISSLLVSGCDEWIDGFRDVAYVAASGSVLAVAGCSSNGANVVVWDTLAPAVTSQASLVCHEGGARSLSVFDNDIGSGSISPLIVTGGQSGDIGLHDFRFIATGKTKRNKHSSEQDFKSMHEYGENANGMLWYIPKAHLGSVTTIATVPETSLFFTGGKDGEVKLWDAKRSRLVFHWPKLHDRHTFLRPNSRGFGGVIRAAVTDIEVLSCGFLTCGGDGCVKLVQIR